MLELDISLLIAVHHQTSCDQIIKTIYSIHNQQHVPSDIILIQDGQINEKLQLELNLIKKNKQIHQHIIINSNQGLANALNTGLKYCKYNLIARIDPEDEVLHDRFYHQYTFMNNHSDVAVCGSFALEVYKKKEKVIKKPTTFSEINKSIKFRNPIIHSTVIFRKNKILSLGGYPDIKKCQDLMLWVKCIQNDLIIRNLPQVLIKTYLNVDMMKRRDIKYFKYELLIYKYQYQKKLISFNDLYKVIIMRFCLRVMPTLLKVYIYKLFR